MRKCSPLDSKIMWKWFDTTKNWSKTIASPLFFCNFPFPQYNKGTVNCFPYIVGSRTVGSRWVTFSYYWKPVGRTLSHTVGSRWECLLLLLLGAGQVGRFTFSYCGELSGAKLISPYCGGWVGEICFSPYCWESLESRVSYIVGSWLRKWKVIFCMLGIDGKSIFSYCWGSGGISVGRNFFPCLSR